MSWLMKYPRIRIVVSSLYAVFSIALIVFFGYAAIKLYREDVNAPDDPVPMSLDEAAQIGEKDRPWVLLQGTEPLQWNCDSIVYWDVTVNDTEAHWMDILLTDPDESLVLVAEFTDQLTCDDLLASQPELSGELIRLTGSSYDDLNYEGRFDRYPPGTTFLKVCTFCDPHNSWAIVGISSFCMLGSIGMMVTAVLTALKTKNILRLDRAAAGPPVPQEAPAPMSKAEIELQLMRAFNFTQADLESNMLGSLGRDQRNRLSKRLHWFLGLIAMLVIGVGAIVLGMSGLVRDEGTTILLLVGGVVALVLGPVGVLLDYLTGRKIREGKVSTRCGTVERQMQKAGDEIHYAATVDGEAFALHADQYAALTDGDVYCFYFLDRVYDSAEGRRILLSVRRM